MDPTPSGALAFVSQVWDKVAQQQRTRWWVHVEDSMSWTSAKARREKDRQGKFLSLKDNERAVFTIVSEPREYLKVSDTYGNKVRYAFNAFVDKVIHADKTETEVGKCMILDAGATAFDRLVRLNDDKKVQGWWLKMHRFTQANGFTTYEIDPDDRVHDDDKGTIADAEQWDLAELGGGDDGSDGAKGETPEARASKACGNLATADSLEDAQAIVREHHQGCTEKGLIAKVNAAYKDAAARIEAMKAPAEGAEVEDEDLPF